MENGTDNENMLNRIRALLAKAESTSFPEEAETYTAKAMQLMAKYGIEQALLEDSQPQLHKGIVDRIFRLQAPFARDKVMFFNAIVNALGGRAIWLKHSQREAGVQTLHVFASATDMDRIDMMFTSLSLQCTVAMNYAVAASREAQVRPRKFKSDFLFGFTNEVGYRLHEAERRAASNAESAAAAQGTTTDLVLLSKKDRVDKALEDAYAYKEAAKDRKRSVGGGYGHGVHAGRNADIGDNKGAKQGALVG